MSSFFQKKQLTTQECSVYYHSRQTQPENNHIWETGIREFGHFFLKNDSKHGLSNQLAINLIVGTLLSI